MITYILSKDKKQFFLINMITVLIFATLYYIQDVFISKNPDIAKKNRIHIKRLRCKR